MKKLILAVGLLGSTACAPATASADFALAIAQPGFTLVIGDVGRPPPAYYAPRVTYVPAPVVVRRPVYYAPRASYGRHHGWKRCHRGRGHHDD